MTGAKSYEELYASNEAIMTSLTDIGVIDRSVDSGFEVRNLVFVGDFNRSVNLSTLAVALGFEVVEYEPEQFPGLVYRPPEYAGTALIFATGKQL